MAGRQAVRRSCWCYVCYDAGNFLGIAEYVCILFYNCCILGGSVIIGQHGCVLFYACCNAAAFCVSPTPRWPERWLGICLPWLVAFSDVACVLPGWPLLLETCISQAVTLNTILPARLRWYSWISR